MILRNERQPRDWLRQNRGWHGPFGPTCERRARLAWFSEQFPTPVDARTTTTEPNLRGNGNQVVESQAAFRPDVDLDRNRDRARRRRNQCSCRLNRRQWNEGQPDCRHGGRDGSINRSAKKPVYD
jgi:hypothetical protein